jgi:acetylornithine deacetylase/succinyl-diaminopimelate desuccinylase-like protein
MNARIVVFPVLLLSLLGSGAPLSAQPPVRDQVRAYRTAHERAIVAELSELLAIPNVAANLQDIRRNADHLMEMLRRRGFETRLLEGGEGSRPAVFGELRTPGATRTIVFYAHYDGQPVDPTKWASDPWKPVLRTGPLGPDTRDVDLASVQGPFDGEWRIFARSASDDKSPIVAILTALDALRAAHIQPSVNLKLFLEGEEEAGSGHLTDILKRHAPLLAADAWILCDGPVHQTRRQQVYFGARGVSGLELTVYGPLRPLHSGHYGNWAPNPAVELAHLVAGLRDEEGRILIPGFYDDVRPLTAAETQAIAALPDVETGLRKELALGRTEGAPARLQERVMLPALNLRGLSAGNVGEAAANAIPTEARASIDFRLVPDQTPAAVQKKVEDHLRRQGWWVTAEAPDAAARLAHPRIVRAEWSLDYPPARTDMGLPVSKAVVAAVSEAAEGGGPVVQLPILGGSVPMSLSVDTLHVPMVGVPMVNHDNNQHGSNENLRLQNLWDGIEVYAVLMARLGKLL